MKKITLQRSLEILPGLLTWSTFILPIFLSFWAPKFISIIILIYASFWFFKTMIITYHMIAGYLRFRHDSRINWLEKCKTDFPTGAWEDIYHMILVPTYKEELGTLIPTFKALKNSNYPTEKLIVVLALEERDKENGLKNAKALQEEFGNCFYKLFTTVHPAGIQGENPGKGSNISYSIREVKSTIVDQNNIPYENIVVTTIDSDHQVDKQYFACVTHTFLNTEDPIHKSFQPIPLFFNNIWQTGFPMRLIAMGSSFWQMVEATRPYRLRNFAAHAQSFAGLVKTDYWSVTSIVEDGHQYWRSYFRFNGNYAVVPIFVPIYQDAVLAGNVKQTLKEQYLQKRRWAWGCSDIPYAVQAAIKNRKIPFFDKWGQVYRLIEGHYSWSTTSIVLAIVGWMPIILNAEYRGSVLAYNYPYYYRIILMMAMLGMIATLSISTILLPPPHQKKHISVFRYMFEWILTPIIMPFTNILFSSLPAIESQTRLMLGKYLGYRVTIKKPVEAANQPTQVQNA
jgi:cellulose synthase/poly-beta-1,6-N-acetylglucosamine synthase-like glycosyltransferase